jgi:hypothetical protein
MLSQALDELKSSADDHAVPSILASYQSLSGKG